MKAYEVAQIRNVAIVGHAQEGKTSLTEAILFDTGAISRLGRVEEGNTATDCDEDEIKRGISISAAVAAVDWKGVKVNLIDTPGFSNFLTDTRICMRVADLAVILVSGVDGVKVQTEKVWGFAEEYGLPVVFFVNKMDRERADLFRSGAGRPVPLPRGYPQEPAGGGHPGRAAHRGRGGLPGGRGSPDDEGRHVSGGRVGKVQGS